MFIFCSNDDMYYLLIINEHPEAKLQFQIASIEIVRNVFENLKNEIG